MHYQRSFRNTVAGIVACLLSSVGYAGQSHVNYKYVDAAREIAQLFWLAETANACGWATRQEADDFEAFAVRFLTAHLSGVQRAAFISMTNDAGFHPGVQRVAFNDHAKNCELERWKVGWASYKSAADENASRYACHACMEKEGTANENGSDGIGIIDFDSCVWRETG